MFEAFKKGDESLFVDSLSSMMIKEAGSMYKRYANLANIAASIFDYMDDINWAGFYLYDGERLVLGPFIGEPACTLIELGRGVCGTAAEKQESIIVLDVSKFAGHIACSSKSKSELVVPIMVGDKLYGVIDIDSPKLDRFKEADRSLIERIAELVSALS